MFPLNFTTLSAVSAFLSAAATFVFADLVAVDDLTFGATGFLVAGALVGAALVAARVVFGLAAAGFVAALPVALALVAGLSAAVAFAAGAGLSAVFGFAVVRFGAEGLAAGAALRAAGLGLATAPLFASMNLSTKGRMLLRQELPAKMP